MTLSTPRTIAAACTLLAVGCGGGGQTGPPSSIPPTTASEPVPTTAPATTSSTTPSSTGPTSTAPTTTGPSSTSSAPSTTTGGATKCAGKGLDVAAQQLDAGAGQTYWKLTFTNKGNVPCEIFGFPGVDPFEGDRQVGAPAKRSEEEPKRFTLAPSESIGAKLRVAQVGNYGPDCRPANVTSVRVTAPDDTHTRPVPFQSKTCANTARVPFSISPVLR